MRDFLEDVFDADFFEKLAYTSLFATGMMLLIGTANYLQSDSALRNTETLIVWVLGIYTVLIVASVSSKCIFVLLNRLSYRR